MNSCMLATDYASSIKIKGKLFILFLRRPDLIEMYGPGIEPAYPLQIELKNSENEVEFKYADEEIWETVKAYKKSLRKRKK